MRALLPLTWALMLRALREGMLVRALIAPGLVTVASLVLVALLFGAVISDRSVAVDGPELAEVMAAVGLEPVVVEDPAGALARGEVVRAAWGQSVGGPPDRATALAESALRDHVGANWRMEVPDLGALADGLEPMARLLAALLALLFALYGVVFGAGALARDRDDGSLEAELALPVRAWVHPAARILGASILLTWSFGVSLGLLDAVLGLDGLAGWALAGSSATLFTVALGLGLMDRTTVESFSGPLSRGLTVTVGLVGLGFALPTVGAWLPLASVGAALRSVPPTGTDLFLAVGVAALVSSRFRGLG